MKEKGLIIKSQKELYHVLYNGDEYLCKARGVFRDKKIKPLVGDRVDIKILENNTAYIEKVYERTNSLVRPPIANIDQIILVHCLEHPRINFLTFDKYLVMLEHYNIPVKIIINKIELASEEQIEEFKDIYSKTNYEFIFTSAKTNKGIDDLYKLLDSKISAFAGPSGVGKSTLLNLLNNGFEAETGSISKKTARGKHTTRHVELFKIKENTFIFDTPGFSALDLSFIENYFDITKYFTEFNSLNSECKFNNCQHENEPNCKVKEQISEKISKSRYENYLYIRNEIKNIRRY